MKILPFAGRAVAYDLAVVIKNNTSHTKATARKSRGGFNDPGPYRLDDAPVSGGQEVERLTGGVGVAHLISQPVVSG